MSLPSTSRPSTLWSDLSAAQSAGCDAGVVQPDQLSAHGRIISRSVVTKAVPRAGYLHDLYRFSRAVHDRTKTCRLTYSEWSEAKQLEDDLRRLDISSAIAHRGRYHPLIKAFFKRIRRPSQPLFDPSEVEFSRSLGDVRNRTRHSEAIARMTNELREAIDSRQWQILATLTLRNDALPGFFNGRNNKWRCFRQSLERRLRAAAEVQGVSFDWSWFAVVERGSLNGRLHIHLWFRTSAIPYSWMVDPTNGGLSPTRRELTMPRDLWEYGFSQWLPVRYPDDPPSRRGWRLPIGDDGSPVPTNPMGVAHYLGKYLSKGLATRPDTCYDDSVWRTRYKRGFGLNLAKSLLQRLPRHLHLPIRPNTPLSLIHISEPTRPY